MTDLYYLHPSSEILDQFAMRRLSESQTAYVEEHLLLCASCCKALDTLERDIRLMRAVLGAQEPVSPIWTRL